MKVAKDLFGLPDFPEEIEKFDEILVENMIVEKEEGNYDEVCTELNRSLDSISSETTF